jgi:hypothetical protein
LTPARDGTLGLTQPGLRFEAQTLFGRSGVTCQRETRGVSEELNVEIGWLAIDCADPSELAGWWQQLLGGTVEEDADGDVSLRGGSVELLFLAVPDAKIVKNRLHLDLRTSDYDAAVAHAIELGALAADEIYGGEGWRVFRDPEGNEFCIIRPK